MDCENDKSRYPRPCNNKEGKDGVAKAHVAPHDPRAQISRRAPSVDKEVNCVEQDGKDNGEEDRYVEEEVDSRESLEAGTRLQVRAEAGRKAKGSTVRIHLECGNNG